MFKDNFRSQSSEILKWKSKELYAVGHERYKISVLSRKRICHGTVTVTSMYIEDIYVPGTPWKETSAFMLPSRLTFFTTEPFFFFFFQLDIILFYESPLMMGKSLRLPLHHWLRMRRWAWPIKFIENFNREKL